MPDSRCDGLALTVHVVQGTGTVRVQFIEQCGAAYIAEADIDARLHLSPSEIAAKEACLRVHEALVTISAEGPADLIRRPPIENYAFLGESLAESGEDLFRSLPSIPRPPSP